MQETLLRRALVWARKLGPGIVTGSADDDPSGISTYSIAGASAGYSMLWIALVTLPMMIAVQGMCARIGLVAGVGPAGVMRKLYPRALTASLILVVVIANTVNLGADLAGMAASARLIFGLPFELWIAAFGVVTIAAEVFFSYKAFESVVKWLCLSLLAYVATAFFAHPNWREVFGSLLVPHIRFEAAWLTTLMGVLGTTITPYLFFWQPAMVIEDERALGRSTAELRGATKSEVHETNEDNWIGMGYSNVMTFFIIVTTAATIGQHGNANIQTAQDAAEALRPFAGDYAYLLFMLGMVGTGLLAVPVLAGSSAYVLADAFAIEGSLADKPRRAPIFYTLIVAGIGIGMIMNFFHLDPIKALYWSAVLNGVAAVPLLVFLTLLGNNASVMGKWKNSRATNVWAWLTVLLMGASAVCMFVFWGK